METKFVPLDRASRTDQVHGRFVIAYPALSDAVPAQNAKVSIIPAP